MKKVLFIMIVSVVTGGGMSFGQKGTTLIRQGNKKYEKGQYQAAEKDYRKALETDKGSLKGQFNLGAAVYRENNYKESANIYGQIAGQKLDPGTLSKVYHNLGNSYLEGKDYEKSIQAYQSSLLNNPKDLDTKYNLEYAKMMLKKQQQQQQQNKNQQKDKKNQQQNQQNQQQNPQNQPPDQKKISKEEANRMLEAMRNDERKTMEKVNKEKAKPVKAGVIKDW
jgi:Ca-activated chloride channel family protein